MPRLFLLLLFAGLGVSLPAAALTAVEIFARAGAGVVILDVLDAAGQPLTVQSATVIGAEQLVTVCSGLEGAGQLQVRARSGQYAATVTARDRERNLCLLSSRGLPESPLPAESGALPVGSRVLAVSNAMALGVGISEGVLSAWRELPVGTLLQFTAPISPGSEGGALLDAQGRLVGIVDYRRRDGQNVNFAAPVAWVQDIDRRAQAAAARLQRFDQAMALLKGRQWKALQALAAQWSAEEANEADAWRFVVAAASGLGDQAGELRGWQAWRRVDPESSAVAVGLGRALLARGKAQEALDLAKQLTAGRTEDAATWLFLGEAQQKSGQLDAADQSYRRAVDLDAWLVAAYQRLAALAQRRGDRRAAIAIWRRLSGLSNDAAWARFGLTRAYLADRDAPRAWGVLSLVAPADSDSASFWYWKGAVLAALGSGEQAMAAFRTSLDKQFDEPDWAWAGIGEVLAEQREYRQAAEAYRAAAQANPENDDWPYYQAINLKDAGFSAQALAITSELVAQHPQVARNWRQHGFVLATLGRAAEAIPALERSLQLDARQGKVWAALIETYHHAGRFDDARRAYQTLRGIDAEFAGIAYREVIFPQEESSR